jgi:hypothetical protein
MVGVSYSSRCSSPPRYPARVAFAKLTELLEEFAAEPQVRRLLLLLLK